MGQIGSLSLQKRQAAAERRAVVHKRNLKIGSNRDANLVQSRCPKKSRSLKESSGGETGEAEAQGRAGG